jgi:CheY-like chemotaxis protein
MRSPTPDVLIADADPTVRAAVRVLLEGDGYDCVEAGDGLDALQFARRTPPRCLLLDLALPRMDGLVVAERLRQDSRTSGVHVHCLTGRTDADTRRRAAEVGCELFLAKPAEPLDVLKAIRRSAWVDGLTMRQAEELLDWLERQGCTHLEAACPTGDLFAVRGLCPPDLSLVRDPDGGVRLLRV